MGSESEMDFFGLHWYVDTYDIIHVAGLSNNGNVGWSFVLFHWHVGVHFHIPLLVNLQEWVIHGDLRRCFLFISYGRIDGLVWDPGIIMLEALFLLDLYALLHNFWNNFVIIRVVQWIGGPWSSVPEVDMGSRYLVAACKCRLLEGKQSPGREDCNVPKILVK